MGTGKISGKFVYILSYALKIVNNGMAENLV